MVKQKKCLYQLCRNLVYSLHGRTDRKFCSNQCRYNHHNERKRNVDPELVRINKILSQNFAILENCLGSEHTAIRGREELLRLGFSFDYYTQAKGDYRFCYYYGYTSRKETQVLIVRGFDNIVKKI